jgi:hypothetical protein
MRAARADHEEKRVSCGIDCSSGSGRPQGRCLAARFTASGLDLRRGRRDGLCMRPRHHGQVPSGRTVRPANAALSIPARPISRDLRIWPGCRWWYETPMQSAVQRPGASSSGGTWDRCALRRAHTWRICRPPPVITSMGIATTQPRLPAAGRPQSVRARVLGCHCGSLCR